LGGGFVLVKPCMPSKKDGEGQRGGKKCSQNGGRTIETRISLKPDGEEEKNHSEGGREKNSVDDQERTTYL